MFILDGVSLSVFFFFNDTATTEIYTLSLHDALPIWIDGALGLHQGRQRGPAGLAQRLTMPLVVSQGLVVWFHGLRKAQVGHCVLMCAADQGDRKSTRLNSSHQIISYAVFCLKKKKNE